MKDKEFILAEEIGKRLPSTQVTVTHGAFWGGGAGFLMRLPSPFTISLLH